MRLSGTFLVCLVLSVTISTRFRTDAVIPNAACSTPTDVSFLIDVSESIAPSDFKLEKQFITNQVFALDDPNRTVHISIIPYNSHVKATVGLQPYKSPSHVTQLINEIPLNVDGTDLVTAFKRMTRVFREEGRRSARKLVILFSDGRVKDFVSAKLEALIARYIGVSLITVGLGQEANVNQLKSFAKNPHLTFDGKDLKDAAQLKDILRNFICPNCSLATDIIFMLDGSESIPSTIFENQKLFLQELMAPMSKVHDKIHIGIILFSSEIKATIGLQPPKTFEQFAAITKSLMQPQEGVKFVSAFRRMRRVFEAEGRSRSNRVGVVITDGWSMDFAAAKKEATMAKEAGIKIVTIGIGEHVKKHELQEYASKAEMAFFSQNFKNLSQMEEPVRNLICSDKTNATNNNETDWGQPWLSNIPTQQTNDSLTVNSSTLHHPVGQGGLLGSNVSMEPPMTVEPLSNNSLGSADQPNTSQNLSTVQRTQGTNSIQADQPKLEAKVKPSENRHVNSTKQSRKKSATKPFLLQLPTVVDLPSEHVFIEPMADKHPKDKTIARTNLDQPQEMQFAANSSTVAGNATLNLRQTLSEPTQLHKNESRGFWNVEAKDTIRTRQTVMNSGQEMTTKTNITTLTTTLTPRKSSTNDQTKRTTENVAESVTTNTTLHQDNKLTNAPLRTKLKQTNRPQLTPPRADTSQKQPSTLDQNVILTRKKTPAARKKGQGWRATLKLGEAQSGGTKSPINIKLYDKDGLQETVALNKRGIPLKKGTPHSFKFSTGYLGNLSKVELFLSISQNPWHLETFQLNNVDTAQSYKFRIGGYSTKETFNVPQEKVKLWRVQVQVGASKDAGTRGLVRVHLHGSNGTSHIISLRSPYHQEFMPGEAVDFYFATKDIGHFERAQILVGQWDLMYLESLMITDIDESKNYNFNYSGFVMNETFYSSTQSKSNKRVPLRLRGGSTRTEGRVELLLNGLWGGVCNRGWDDNDARVVCRMMGYRNGRAMSTFPGGAELILMDGVRCTGQEMTIMQCERADSHSCEASNAAGVSCFNTESKNTAEKMLRDQAVGEPNMKSSHRSVTRTREVPRTVATLSTFKSSHVTREQSVTPRQLTLGRETNVIQNSKKSENMKQDLRPTEKMFGDQAVGEPNMKSPHRSVTRTREVPRTVATLSTFKSSHVTREQSVTPRQLTLGRETNVIQNNNPSEKDLRPTEKMFRDQAVGESNMKSSHRSVTRTREVPRTVATKSSHVTREQSVTPRQSSLGRETNVIQKNNKSESMKQNTAEKRSRDQAVGEPNMKSSHRSVTRTREVPRTVATHSTFKSSHVTREQSVTPRQLTLGRETNVIQNNNKSESRKHLQPTEKMFRDQAVGESNMKSSHRSVTRTREVPRTVATLSTFKSSHVTREQSVTHRQLTLGRETNVIQNNNKSKMNKDLRPTENRLRDQAVGEPNMKSPHRSVSRTREIPRTVDELSTLKSSHVTREQSMTPRPFSLGRETHVTQNNNTSESMKRVSTLHPSSDVGNSGAETRVIITTKSTTSSPTTTAAIHVRPTTNKTIATSTTTTRTRTKTSKPTTVKTIEENVMSDSKKEASISPTSRQQKSKTLKEIPKILSSSRNASSKKATNVDIWDSVLGEAHHDVLAIGTTTRKSPFLDLAERKLQNSGLVVKPGTAHIWESRRATPMSSKPTAEPKSKIAVQKPPKVQSRPVKVTPLNEKKHNLTRLLSSKVSPTERSSSDAIVPIADIILPILIAEKMQAKETQVMLNSALQKDHGSNVKNVPVHPTTKTIRSVMRRPVSIVHPPLNIESVSKSEFSRPAEIDIKLGGLAGQRSKDQNKNHVGPFDVVSSSRKSTVVDPLLSEPKRQFVPPSRLNQNPTVDLAWLGQHTKVDVARIPPGVNVQRDRALHLASLKESFGGLNLRPVPVLESIAKNRPSPGQSVHTVNAFNANNRQHLSPNNVRERQKVDWTPIPSNRQPNNIAIQRPRLFSARSNQVEQKPIMAKGRLNSFNINPSVNSPRSKDFGVIQLRPALFQVTTMKPASTTIYEKVEGCLLAPYEQDERYYLEFVHGFTTVVRPCPIGTVFRMKICTCTSPVNGIQQSHLQCSIEFQLEFEYDIKDSSGKNLFASSENVHLEQSAGRFVGNSYISVWRFQEAEFGDKITIRLSFRQDSFQPGVQHLVGNCVPGGAPSVSISIDQRRGKVIYTITTYTDSRTIEDSYNTNNWNEVTLAYDGKTMQGITNGLQNFKYLEGKIQKRGSPLKFGICETTQGFQGLLDSVQIYMCFPGEHGTSV